MNTNHLFHRQGDLLVFLCETIVTQGRLVTFAGVNADTGLGQTQ